MSSYNLHVVIDTDSHNAGPIPMRVTDKKPWLLMYSCLEPNYALCMITSRAQQQQQATNTLFHISLLHDSKKKIFRWLVTLIHHQVSFARIFLKPLSRFCYFHQRILFDFPACMGNLFTIKFAVFILKGLVVNFFV